MLKRKSIVYYYYYYYCRIYSASPFLFSQCSSSSLTRTLSSIIMLIREFNCWSQILFASLLLWSNPSPSFTDLINDKMRKTQNITRIWIEFTYRFQLGGGEAAYHVKVIWLHAALLPSSLLTGFIKHWIPATVIPLPSKVWKKVDAALRLAKWKEVTLKQRWVNNLFTAFNRHLPCKDTFSYV